jgi:hypothetical protein
MFELRLTARSQVLNTPHARIAVWQNGGHAGVLVVEHKAKQAVLGALNGHADLLSACKQMLEYIQSACKLDDEHTICVAAKKAIDQARGIEISTCIACGSTVGVANRLTTPPDFDRVEAQVQRCILRAYCRGEAFFPHNRRLLCAPCHCKMWNIEFAEYPADPAEISDQAILDQ